LTTVEASNDEPAALRAPTIIIVPTARLEIVPLSGERKSLDGLEPETENHDPAVTHGRLLAAVPKLRGFASLLCRNVGWPSYHARARPRPARLASSPDTLTREVHHWSGRFSRRLARESTYRKTACGPALRLALHPSKAADPRIQRLKAASVGGPRLAACSLAAGTAQE
jgi:hypothetical protein